MITKLCLYCKKPILGSDLKVNKTMKFCYQCVEEVSMNERLRALIRLEKRKPVRGYH